MAGAGNELSSHAALNDTRTSAFDAGMRVGALVGIVVFFIGALIVMDAVTSGLAHPGAWMGLVAFVATICAVAAATLLTRRTRQLVANKHAADRAERAAHKAKQLDDFLRHAEGS